MLRGVVGVDTDIFVRQISGPELAGAGSLMKVDIDGELGLLDVGVSCGLVELVGTSAVAADWKFAECDVDALRVNLRAGVSDGGHQAAPVGIATGPCSFDKRRMSNRLGHTDRIGVGDSAVDV